MQLYKYFCQWTSAEQSHAVSNLALKYQVDQPSHLWLGTAKQSSEENIDFTIYLSMVQFENISIEFIITFYRLSVTLFFV